MKKLQNRIIKARKEVKRRKEGKKRKEKRPSPIILPPRSSTVNISLYSPKNKGNGFKMHYVNSISRAHSEGNPIH